MIKQNEFQEIDAKPVSCCLTLQSIEERLEKPISESTYKIGVRCDEIRIGGAVFGSKLPCLLLANLEHMKDYFKICLFLDEEHLHIGFTGTSRFASADSTKELFFDSAVDMGGSKFSRFLGDYGVASFNKSARRTALTIGVTKEAVAMAKDVAKGGIKNLGGRKEKKAAEDSYYQVMLHCICEACLAS